MAGPHTQFVQSFIEECVECLEQGSRGSILQFMPFTMVSDELGGGGVGGDKEKDSRLLPQNGWDYLPCVHCLLILEDLLHLPTCRNVAVAQLSLLLSCRCLSW